MQLNSFCRVFGWPDLMIHLYVFPGLMYTSQVLMSLWDTETAMSTAGAPFEGTGMDTRPRVPVLNIIREEVRREGHCVSLQAHLSNTDSDEIREGGT